MNSYLNLQAEPHPLKLLDEPDGYISAMTKANLGHQMRYSTKLLERELASEGVPRILQLQTDGDDRYPSFWRLYVNGRSIASGTGEFARQCFERDERAYLHILRSAVEEHAELLQEDAFALLDAAREIAKIECRIERTLTHLRPQDSY